MQSISNFVNCALINYCVDDFDIQNVQGRLNEKMKVDGWISIILSNSEFVLLKFNNGVFMNEGFVVNDQKVFKVVLSHQVRHI